jgi:hypothetical protein
MLYNILKKMQERPGLFTCESVDDILIFIEGYSQALWEFNIIDGECKYFAENFTNYVKRFHKMKAHHPNWATIIRFYSATEHESFINFFNLFNKFIEYQEINK